VSRGNPILPLPFSASRGRCVEFLALPGPEARAGRAKIMRPISFPGPGGQGILLTRSSSFPCRGDPAGRPMGPPRSAEAREDLSGELMSRRCFLPAPPLPPGHKIKIRGRWIPQSEGEQETRLESRIFLLPTPAYSSNILGRGEKKRVASHGMSLLPQPKYLPQEPGR
jgi:hypothetical protein